MKRKLLALLMASVVCAGIIPAYGQAEGKDVPGREPVTLKMWWPGSGDNYEALANGLADLVNEKYDWITVETLVIPWSDYDSKMSVAFAGGTAPDIFGVGLNTLPSYVQTGNMVKLDEYLDEGWDGWSDIPENILNYTNFEGSFYGVLFCDLRPFMWRKDMFEAAGLDPDTPPSSKEELLEFAEKLTQYDEDGRVTTAGFQIQTSGFVDQTLFSSMLMHGLEYYWDDSYELDLLNEKMIASVEYCKSFIDKGLCDYSEGIVTTSFSEGFSAMTLNTACNELGNLKDTIGFDNIGVAAPFMNEGQNFCGGSIVCMNNKTSDLEAALLAYEVMTGKEGCELAGSTAGFCPPRVSATEAYVAQEPEIFGPIAEILPKAKTFGPLNPYYADFRNIAVLPYIEQIYYGKIDIQEGLKKATEDYTQARKDRDLNN